jgi:hypothetical protein
MMMMTTIIWITAAVIVTIWVTTITIRRRGRYKVLMAAKSWEIKNGTKFIRAAISSERMMATVRGRGYIVTAYYFDTKAAW